MSPPGSTPQNSRHGPAEENLEPGAPGDSGAKVLFVDPLPRRQ